MATKNGKAVTYRERYQTINLQNTCHVTSRGELKTLYLHYHNAYGHQTY